MTANKEKELQLLIKHLRGFQSCLSQLTEEGNSWSSSVLNVISSSCGSAVFMKTWKIATTIVRYAGIYKSPTAVPLDSQVHLDYCTSHRVLFCRAGGFFFIPNCYEMQNERKVLMGHYFTPAVCLTVSSVQMHSRMTEYKLLKFELIPVQVFIVSYWKI